MARTAYSSGPEENETNPSFRTTKRGQGEVETDLRNLLQPEVVEKVNTELDAIKKRLDSNNPEEVAEAMKAQRERAPQDADVLAEAYKLRALVERVPNWQGSPTYTTKHQTAQQIIRDIQDKNPYAVDVNDRRRAEQREQRYEARQTEMRAMRSRGTLSLHKASANQDGFFAVNVRGEDRRNPGRRFEGVALLQATNGEARIVEATSQVRFLEKFGYYPSQDDEEKREKWVALNPPEFKVEKGARFPQTLEEALANLWSHEEKMGDLREQSNAVLARREITATQMMAREKGFCAFHVPKHEAKWRDKDDRIQTRRGWITLGFQCHGDGTATLTDCITPAFKIAEYIGKTYQLESLPPFLNGIVKGRLSYEAWKEQGSPRASQKSEEAEPVVETEGALTAEETGSPVEEAAEEAQTVEPKAEPEAEVESETEAVEVTPEESLSDEAEDEKSPPETPRRRRQRSRDDEDK